MTSSSIAQRLSSRFIALCDRFVHPSWRDDEALLFRGRFQIGVLIAYQLIIITSLCSALLFLPNNDNGMMWLVVLQGSLLAVFQAQMRSLRRHGNLKLTARISITMVFVTIQLGVIITGGPLKAAILGVLVIPAVLAMGLMGWRHGVYLGAFILLLQLLLIALDSLGVQLPNVSPPEVFGTHRLFGWAVVFPALIGIVLVYETVNSHLQRDRDRQHRRHEYLATHDLLTGLANRKLLVESLNALLLRMQQDGSNAMAAVVYLDLNGFKNINDQLGHAAGDRVLQIVAQRLRGAARKGDVLARMGGDEFAVLMEDIGSASNAEHAVLRLQQALSEPIAEYPDYPISGSFGIAMAPTVSTEAMALMQVADQAMYLAKKQKQIVVTVNAPVASNAVEVHQQRAGIVSLNAIAADELPPAQAAPAETTPARRGKLAWLARAFLAHCDRILPPRLRAEPDQLIRARTLIGMARFVQAAMVFIIPILWLNATTIIDYVVMLGLALFGATFSALLGYLHRSGNLNGAINWLLFLAFTVVQGCTLINGGIIKSPAMDLVVVPVLMAFCLSGRRAGLQWAAATVAFHIGVAIVLSLGIDFALVHKEELFQETFGAWIIAFVGILLIVYIFEWINLRLQKERERQYNELEFLASHDALTGLASRRKFHEALSHALERLRQTRESVAVIYLDLDGFKPVNDTLGHAVGDIVLQTVARRIGRNLRSSDIVARLGGDEFGIVLQGVSTVDDAAQIATKIGEEIARPIRGLERFPVSGSIGIAMAPQHSEDGDTLVRMADQAMFRAKTKKRTVAVYN
jgi:diguanylate cyclase (GGDEF)-like protein